MKNYIQKVLLLIVSFSLLTFAHERHEELVPKLDKVLIENLITLLEKKQIIFFEILEPLEKKSFMIDWFFWLNATLSLDTSKGNEELLKDLKLINYHQENIDDEILDLWENDMRYLANIFDAIHHPKDIKKLEEELKYIDYKDFERVEKIHYFYMIHSRVHKHDKVLLKPFIKRLEELINNAKGV